MHPLFCFPEILGNVHMHTWCIPGVLYSQLRVAQLAIVSPQVHNM